MNENITSFALFAMGVIVGTFIGAICKAPAVTNFYECPRMEPEEDADGYDADSWKRRN